MSWNDHNHRGEYAERDHSHSFWDLNDVAEQHHRHHDDESTARGLREDLSQAEERIRELVDGLRDALNRIHVLEDERDADARREEWELREAAAREPVYRPPDDEDGPAELAAAVERIRVLERQTPQAQRLQAEADQAAADLAESGYDRHGRGCQCSYCATEDEPDERGASEYHREEFALDRGEEPW